MIFRSKKWSDGSWVGRAARQVPGSFVLSALAVLWLSGCAEETLWLKRQAGLPVAVVVDPALAGKIRSDAAAGHFVVEDALLVRSLTETLRQPGHFRWFATLVGADGGDLTYVGTQSAKTDDDTVDTDVIFKNGSVGTLDIHLVIERRDGVWSERPDSYKVSATPPVPPAKNDRKRAM